MDEVMIKITGDDECSPENWILIPRNDIRTLDYAFDSGHSVKHRLVINGEPVKCTEALIHISAAIAPPAVRVKGLHFEFGKKLKCASAAELLEELKRRPDVDWVQYDDITGRSECHITLMNESENREACELASSGT